MTLDITSIISGALFGFGIGVLVGFFLGLYSYGRTTKDIYARIRGFIKK